LNTRRPSESESRAGPCPLLCWPTLITFAFHFAGNQLAAFLLVSDGNFIPLLEFLEFSVLVVELNLGIILQDKLQILSVLVCHSQFFLVGRDFLDLSLCLQVHCRTRQSN